MLLRSFVVLAITFPTFAGSVEGIHNFYKVDDHVYRGAQPSEDGIRYLAKIGIKTIIDLREPGVRADREQQTVTAQGMKYVNVPMTGLTPPTDAEITKILGMLEDNTTGPVFVHCMRGADRTGAVIGAYRIDHDGWENLRALKEAMADGMSFFQVPRQHFIRDFHARTMEAKGQTKSAGVEPAAATRAHGTVAAGAGTAQ